MKKVSYFFLINIGKRDVYGRKEIVSSMRSSSSESSIMSAAFGHNAGSQAVIQPSKIPVAQDDLCATYERMDKVMVKPKNESSKSEIAESEL